MADPERNVVDLHQYKEQRPYRGKSRAELEKELANLDAESDYHYKLSLEIGEKAIAVAGLLNLDELASGNGMPEWHGDPGGAA